VRLGDLIGVRDAQDPSGRVNVFSEQSTAYWAVETWLTPLRISPKIDDCISVLPHYASQPELPCLGKEFQMFDRHVAIRALRHIDESDVNSIYAFRRQGDPGASDLLGRDERTKKG
jgi:hypothetical protein